MRKDAVMENKPGQGTWLMNAGTHQVCPWWLAYLFDNPVRRSIDAADPKLAPYVQRGMTVLDFGCGFGHYTRGLARLVGETGQVWAVDVQQKMLDKMLKRARKAGLDGIIRPILCSDDGIGQKLSSDFLVAAHSLHETPDPSVQLGDFFRLLNPGGTFLLLEPCAHLNKQSFEKEMYLAEEAGFERKHRSDDKRQYQALFHKPSSTRSND